ncbi:DBH-like monooxygenase protein 2 homolog [Stylophora pistillata]|uniref:DBH-like monooxygenase protein 2 homolog n=1 Tax=Stylophora pistillata TaxID=50429 RepID=UPI000C042C8A|nr:DBH-like monooxygenase protein 2 homolog [Stylophora pistillata]
MSRLFFFAVIILLFKFSIVNPKETFSSVYLDGEKAFKLYWAYNDSTDIVNFVLQVNTLGWVGFGFANKINRMKNYDVIVGKVQNRRGSVTDRFTRGYSEPLADRNQDYNLIGFNESNGKTFLEFYRKRDTGDSKDVEIKPGPMLLVYAHHTLDYPSPYKTKHEKQGFKMVTLIPADTGTTQAPERSTNVKSLAANNRTETTTLTSFTATSEENSKARVLGSISSRARGSTFLSFFLSLCLFVQSQVIF